MKKYRIAESRHLSNIVLAICVAVGGSIASAQTPPNSAVQKSTDVLPMDGPLKAELTDQSFAENAMAIGLAVIEMSKLVKTKSSNKEIAEFADAAIREHTVTNDKLRKVAKDINLKLPMSLQAAQQTIIQQLKSQSGKEFDLTYTQLMKREHDTEAGMFDRAAGEPKLNPQLKAFATDRVNTLGKIQQRAHALSDIWNKR